MIPPSQSQSSSAAAAAAPSPVSSSSSLHHSASASSSARQRFKSCTTKSKRSQPPSSPSSAQSFSAATATAPFSSTAITTAVYQPDLQVLSAAAAAAETGSGIQSASERLSDGPAAASESYISSSYTSSYSSIRSSNNSRSSRAIESSSNSGSSVSVNHEMRLSVSASTSGCSSVAIECNSTENSEPGCSQGTPIEDAPGTAGPPPANPSVPADTVHAPRKGLFYTSELLSSREAIEWESEFWDLERICLIRFPPEIAAILKQRVAAQLAADFMRENDRKRLSVADGCDYDDDGAEEYYYGGSGNSNTVYSNYDDDNHRDNIEEACHSNRYSDSGAGLADSWTRNSTPHSTHDLGLTITPTTTEDYRMFDVTVEGALGVPASTIYMKGVLVELPCILEAYKSFDSDLLFKSNDISQMIYVFHPSAAAAAVAAVGDDEKSASAAAAAILRKLKNEQLWEWHSGVTPATHRIRSRKFRNFRVFERSDVSMKEKELFDIINQKNPRELTLLEPATEFTCEIHLAALQLGQLNSNSNSNSNSSSEPNVVSIIGPDNPVLRAALDGISLSKAQELMNSSNRNSSNRNSSTRNSSNSSNTPVGDSLSDSGDESTGAPASGGGSTLKSVFSKYQPIIQIDEVLNSGGSSSNNNSTWSNNNSNNSTGSPSTSAVPTEVDQQQQQQLFRFSAYPNVVLLPDVAIPDDLSEMLFDEYSDNEAAPGAAGLEEEEGEEDLVFEDDDEGESSIVKNNNYDESLESSMRDSQLSDCSRSSSSIQRKGRLTD